MLVSAASAWEIATKVRLGKLDWPAEAGSVHAYVQGQGFRSLPISLAHAERAGQLPIAMRDPFDRMLIARTESSSGRTRFEEDWRCVFDTLMLALLS